MKWKPIILLCCLFPASTVAQPHKGLVELSLAGTFGSFTTKSESGGTSTTSDATGFLVLSFRPGYFITDAIEFEPEILMTAAKGSPPVFNFTGNLLYNFNLEGSTTIPFVAAGYGVGNGTPLNRILLFRSSSDLDVSILTFGGGAKFFLSERTAFRAEYRYQRYSQESSFTFFGGTSTVTSTRMSHDFFIGFSVFLGKTEGM